MVITTVPFAIGEPGRGLSFLPNAGRSPHAAHGCRLTVPYEQDRVSSPWPVIDALVHDIGALSAQVHVAERTLASDPRTGAARRALDLATDAVCSAIDDTSEAAATRATAAIEEARALIAQLGMTAETSRSLLEAGRKLVAASERERHRTEAMRKTFGERRRNR